MIQKVGESIVEKRRVKYKLISRKDLTKPKKISGEEKGRRTRNGRNSKKSPRKDLQRRKRKTKIILLKIKNPRELSNECK